MLLKKVSIPFRLSILILFLFIYRGSNAQTGNYYITNYTPSNYGGTDQNFGVVQDSLGRIYAANLSGCLMYDGEYWRMNNLKPEGPAVSIAANQFGQIFVGGIGQFGYLEKNKKGNIEYKSLSDTLSESERNFENVWFTIVNRNEVYFCSSDALYVYDYNSIKSFKKEGSRLHTYFKVDKHLFIREEGIGFKVYNNKKLNFVVGSENFKDLKVRFILPKKDNEYWVGTENGMYTLSYNPIKPEASTFLKTPCPIDNWMIENTVYCGIQLKNGTYIIGSSKNGIVHVTTNFNPVKFLNSESGLQDDNILSLYEDGSNNIWLSLYKGISYIELNSAITKWGKHDGVKGSIESCIKFNNTIYIATDKGLQKYNSQNNRFEITSLSGQCWDLSVIRDKLVVATSTGVYLSNGYEFALAAPDELYDAFKIVSDPADKSVVYIGSSNLFTVAKLEGNNLAIIKQIEVKSNVRSIAANQKKILLGGSGWIAEYDKIKQQIKEFGKEDGLTEGTEYCAFSYNNRNYFAAINGVWFVNEKSKIENDTSFKFPSDSYQIAKPGQIGKDIFFQSSSTLEGVGKAEEISSFTLIDGQFRIDKKLLKRIRDVNAKHFYKDDSLLYISTNDGLFCYELNYSHKPTPFATFISTIISKKDTLFNNYSAESHWTMDLPYSDNELTIYVSAANYLDKSEMEFAYYLEGKDDDYGLWTKLNKISFSNLFEGKYTLHLKSRDVLGNESEPLSFSFRIIAPWYRTIWAYIAYFILAVIIIYIIVKLNTKRLRAYNLRLESTIKQRTQTIAHQMVEIEHKNKEITDSINYAKGIQDSILPDKKDIITTWKDTFVYFQPKDIVSGDFFWYKKITEHEFLIACADCTGHGVPGGFMSMICSDKLHDAAKTSTEPKDILFGANNGVKATLRQEIMVEGKSKDGMEVCLLRVNTQTQEVKYSGANRLMWIVDGETKELTEIKPTKASIASFTEFNFEYQQQEFKLKKGDIVYTTSDGFPDQFGGPDGKKYMSKKMKAFIISICEKPMAEQHDLLKAEINDWMLGHEQVDDLLVIGVRF